MSEVVVAKSGKNLAIRVPHEIARSLGLSDGESVEIEATDGDIVIRRRTAKAAARRDAQAAVAEIIAAAAGQTLGELPIWELRDEGRCR